MEATLDKTALTEELAWLTRQIRPPRLRSMREFAEQELVMPSGPKEGRRFRAEWQPFTRFLFEAIDSGKWNRIVCTGPTQSGKSFASFVVPAMYHLFEVGETVILGLPSLDMAGDKWLIDLLPAIEASRYRELLPEKGPGSRGGRVESIRFRNGRTLKFMTGGGGDKSRAGFTSRVLIVTETDGMDRASETSREADKITQLEARTRAYGSRKRVYMECTVSTSEGRTWREFSQGTASRIALPCPHCRAYVTPGRDDLHGWRDAGTDAEAKEHAAFHCPACAVAWTEEERRVANAGGVLVHRGQEVEPDGRVIGEPPLTPTLGFRWSAVNNHFLSASEIASDEWRAARSHDGDNAEKEQLQFVWALPHDPDVAATTKLEVDQIQRRVIDLPRGVVPADAECLVVGKDCGKWSTHWVALAFRPGGTPHVVDYGIMDVATDQLGVERGLLNALREFRDLVALKGWPVGTPDGPPRKPDQVWIDSAYMQDVVYTLCRESVGLVVRPTVGRGHGQQHALSYTRPKSTGNLVRFIGEGFHVVRLKKDRVDLVEINSDHWKSWVHQRLSVAVGEPGGLTIYKAAPHEHLKFAQHLTAEYQEEEFVAGKGVILRWFAKRRMNHWFDATYNACAAGWMAGARLIGDAAAPAPRVAERREGLKTPSGMAFVATER